MIRLVPFCGITPQSFKASATNNIKFGQVDLSNLKRDDDIQIDWGDGYTKMGLVEEVLEDGKVDVGIPDFGIVYHTIFNASGVAVQRGTKDKPAMDPRIAIGISKIKTVFPKRPEKPLVVPPQEPGFLQKLLKRLF